MHSSAYIQYTIFTQARKTRLSNRNSIVRNCAELRGIVRNCAKLIGMARNSARIVRNSPRIVRNSARIVRNSARIVRNYTELPGIKGLVSKIHEIRAITQHNFTSSSQGISPFWSVFTHSRCIGFLLEAYKNV